MDLLKKFDFFQKYVEHVEIKKSVKGGAIFSLFLLLITVLSCIELYAFTLGDPIVKPFVSTTKRGEAVRVNLNISIHEIPCEALTLDYQDVTGLQVTNVQQTIFKLDLNSDGYVIDPVKYNEVKKATNKNFYPPSFNWKIFDTGVSSCYGAEMIEGQVCKTCEDVKRVYRQRQWQC